MLYRDKVSANGGGQIKGAEYRRMLLIKDVLHELSKPVQVVLDTFAGMLLTEKAGLLPDRHIQSVRCDKDVPGL